MPTDHYAVMGNPIKHSLSPQIHAQFALQTQQNLNYEKYCIDVEQFEQQVLAFFTGGGCGLNITLPFKQRAWRLAQCLSQRAQVAGSVNTLWQDQQGILCGDNTDGIGLLRDIEQNLAYPLKGQNILILGAGGAVRGVLQPILQAQPQQVVIANRTLTRAEELVTQFKQYGSVRCCDFAELGEQAFDWIINGTSVSLQGEMVPISAQCLHRNSKCYDMVFADKLTPFLQWALDKGAVAVFDGIGMLVEQAAEAFFIWRKIHPDSRAVITEMKNNRQSL